MIDDLVKRLRDNAELVEARFSHTVAFNIREAADALERLSQQAEPVTTETAIYNFAGWLTCRDGVMPVGSTSNAAPMAEAVNEYIKTYPERFAAPDDEAVRLLREARFVMSGSRGAMNQEDLIEEIDAYLEKFKD